METRTVQIMLVSLVQKITNLITTLDFIQSEPVSDVVKGTKYKLFFLSEDDFSKIQGRFDTRLSLSSANVDEVIMRRFPTKISMLPIRGMRMYKSVCSVCALHSRTRSMITIKNTTWWLSMRAMM